MRAARLPILLLVVLLAAGAAGAAAGRPPEPGPRDFRALAELLEARAAARQFSGVVAVAREGAIVYGGAFGLASEELAVPNDLQTRFKLHSLSKPMLAVVALRAAERYGLGLDAPMSSRLDGWPQAWSAVTTRHLLSHTSGVPDLAETFLSSWAGNLGATWKQVSGQVAGLDLQFEPGQDWRYSNGGYVLVACALERAIEGPIAAILDRELFGPAGMAGAGVEVTPPWDEVDYDGASVVPRLASGYNGGPDRLQVAHSRMYTIPGAGGIHATAPDLVAFAHAAFEGDLLGAGSRAALTDVPEGRAAPYALGWVVGARDGRTVFRHDGGNNGFVASLEHYPQTKLSIAILCNYGFVDLGGLRGEVAEAVFADLGEAPGAPDGTRGAAGEPDLRRLLEANARAMVLEGGRLHGAGAELILGEGRKAQFVAIGEQHNHRQIPGLTLALFEALHEQAGFDYLVLEQDPVMMRRVSRAPYRGDLEAIHDLARAYKHGFTFISDQELQLVAGAGIISNGGGDPIWGCEQAFGLTHILEALLPLAPGEDARASVAALLDAARAAEAERDLEAGHHIGEESLAPALEALARRFAPVRDTDVRFLVDAAVTSNEIYGYYQRGRRGEVPGNFSNNFMREEYMKRRFIESYRRAAALDGRPPRGVLKYGHYHLYRGISPTRLTSTLGSFAHAVARMNDMGFLAISVHSFGGEYGDFREHERLAYLRPFAPVLDETGWTVVDVRPFREYPHRRALLDSMADLEPAMEESLDRLIYGFDLALFIGGGESATWDVTGVAY